MPRGLYTDSVTAMSNTTTITRIVGFGYRGSLSTSDTSPPIGIIHRRVSARFAA
jgi:hypothetical protein